MPVQEEQLVNGQVCRLLRHRRAESPFNWSFSWTAPFSLLCGQHFQHLARPDLSLNVVSHRICLPFIRRPKIACPSLSQNETEHHPSTGFVDPLTCGEKQSRSYKKKRVLRAGCGKVLAIWGKFTFFLYLYFLSYNATVFSWLEILSVLERLKIAGDFMFIIII